MPPATAGRRGPRVGLVVAAAAALAAAGCTTARPAPVPFPAAAPDAHAGGTVTVGLGPPGSLDPSKVDGADDELVLRTMCDPLVQLDPGSGALVPAIAESWRISDAGRRLVLQLRRGVRFSDGNEVTARDVMFSLSRAASRTPLKPIRAMRVVGTHTLEVRLSAAGADFVTVLAEPLASPVSRRAVEQDPSGFAAKPVCAGPYELERPWHPGDATMVLRRSPHYTPVNAGYTAGGRGYADRIEFRILIGRTGELDAYQAGGLDVAFVAPTDADLAPPLDADLVRAPGPGVEYVGLPVRVPPFDRKEVRLALSLALDRQAFAAGVFDGAAAPAQGFLPPAVGDTHRPGACGDATPVRADVDRARAVLAAAGIDGRSLVLRLNVDDNFIEEGAFDHRAVAAVLAEQWRHSLGVTVVPVGLPRPGYDALAASAEGFDGPFRLAWTPPDPSPDAYLAPLFSSASVPPDNASRFSSPTFDRLLDKARRATGTPARGAAYQELEDLACHELPVIPIDVPAVHHLVRGARVASARRMTDRSTGQIVLRELYLH